MTQIIKGIKIPEAFTILNYEIIQEDGHSTEIEGMLEADGVWETFALSINPGYAIFASKDVLLTLKPIVC